MLKLETTTMQRFYAFEVKIPPGYNKVEKIEVKPGDQSIGLKIVYDLPFNTQVLEVYFLSQELCDNMYYILQAQTISVNREAMVHAIDQLITYRLREFSQSLGAQLINLIQDWTKDDNQG